MRKKKAIIAYCLVSLILQIICENSINIFPYISIFIFPIFIINLPTSVNRASLLLIAFCTGIILDLFSNNMIGLYTASILPVAYLRDWTLQITISKRNLSSINDINLNNLPNSSIIPYYIILVAIFHSVYFGIEGFDADNLALFMWKCIISLPINILLTILLSNYLFRK